MLYLFSSVSGYSLNGESEPEDALEPFIQQAIDQVQFMSCNDWPLFDSY